MAQFSKPVSLSTVLTYITRSLISLPKTSSFFNLSSYNLVLMNIPLNSTEFFGKFFMLILIYMNLYSIFDGMWLAFGEIDLNLDDTVLTINRKLFRLSKIDRINRSSMAEFYQRKDAGRPRRDWFDGWGLKIKTNNGKKISILDRQPIEISDWLGDLLSEVYTVKFYPTFQRK